MGRIPLGVCQMCQNGQNWSKFVQGGVAFIIISLRPGGIGQNLWGKSCSKGFLGTGKTVPWVDGMCQHYVGIRWNRLNFL